MPPPHVKQTSLDSLWVLQLQLQLQLLYLRLNKKGNPVRVTNCNFDCSFIEL